MGVQAGAFLSDGGNKAAGKACDFRVENLPQKANSSPCPRWVLRIRVGLNAESDSAVLNREHGDSQFSPAAPDGVGRPSDPERDLPGRSGNSSRPFERW